jgi:mono/diheme cytochrome c family protein
MNKKLRRASFLFLAILCMSIFSGCDYARMYDQRSVRTYRKEAPPMDERTMPVEDGFQQLLTADPKTLKNPLPAGAGPVSQGKEAYGYFCIHCHGRAADGNGTVGQSFSPLPTDLHSPLVQSQTEGELYAKIRLGYKRHPVLYSTISEHDTWAVVKYIRSLGTPKTIVPG